MKWRERMVCQILLLVARIVAGSDASEELKKELENVKVNIYLYGEKEK